MSPKTKLGRNPFQREKTSSKTQAPSSSHSRKRHSEKRLGDKRVVAGWKMSLHLVEQISKAVRFLSFEAPLGICFLTFRACKRIGDRVITR